MERFVIEQSTDYTLGREVITVVDTLEEAEILLKRLNVPNGSVGYSRNRTDDFRYVIDGEPLIYLVSYNPVQQLMSAQLQVMGLDLFKNEMVGVYTFEKVRFGYTGSLQVFVRAMTQAEAFVRAAVLFEKYEEEQNIEDIDHELDPLSNDVENGNNNGNEEESA